MLWLNYGSEPGWSSLLNVQVHCRNGATIHHPNIWSHSAHTLAQDGFPKFSWSVNMQIVNRRSESTSDCISFLWMFWKFYHKFSVVVVSSGHQFPSSTKTKRNTTKNYPLPNYARTPRRSADNRRFRGFSPYGHTPIEGHSRSSVRVFFG